MNAIGCFQNYITATSSIGDDWANLENICTQMKFYSPETVEKMTRVFGIKWGTRIEASDSGTLRTASKRLQDGQAQDSS